MLSCKGTFPQARSFIKVIANWCVYMVCSFILFMQDIASYAVGGNSISHDAVLWNVHAG